MMSKVIPFPNALPNEEELTHQGTITVEVYECPDGDPFLKIQSTFDPPSSYAFLIIAAEFFDE